MIEPESEQTIRKAGRPRSAQSHQAILEATLALFAEEGLAGSSIEAIAERAGVGKTTIYRRWPSKEDVIKDALTLFREDLPLPDTGNIRNDLLYIAKGSQELFNRNPLTGKLMTRLIAEIKTKPEIYRAFYEKLVAPRIQQFCQMVERAQERGELRPDLDATFILYLIFSSLVYGNIFNELIDPDVQQLYDPESAVDALLWGIGTQPSWPGNDAKTKTHTKSQNLRSGRMPPERMHPLLTCSLPGGGICSRSIRPIIPACVAWSLKPSRRA
ncbi:MAG: TetR/AcrR family transcriptional regulator [Chloroflexi bacterium]|nr:MAG: TetR/AcrR family transcriptional regulator [Chloroflexota bacterium]